MLRSPRLVSGLDPCCAAACSGSRGIRSPRPARSIGCSADETEEYEHPRDARVGDRRTSPAPVDPPEDHIGRTMEEVDPEPDLIRPSIADSFSGGFTEVS